MNAFDTWGLGPKVWLPLRWKEKAPVMVTGETLLFAYRKVVFMLCRILRELEKASLEYTQAEVLS